MSPTRFATPLMLSLTAAGSLGLAHAAATGIVDLPHGYGVIEDTKAPTEGKCGEGKCGEQHADEAKKTDHEGKCGEGKCGAEQDKAPGKDDAEGKCGEGKCGEGNCGTRA